MDRIEAMKAYKVRQEQKAKDDADAEKRRTEELALGIRSLKDRIQKLIETANACIENGIPITHRGGHSFQSDDSWERGEFYANSISHKVGFTQRDREFLNRIDSMGINGGGANGEHYLRTNGEYVICTTGKLPEIYQMDKFLKDFDSFETAFYAYIDKIVAH